MNRIIKLIISTITQAIGSVPNWFSCFIVELIFPPLQELMGNYVFVLFIVICGFFAAFVKFYGVESKGKTPKQIKTVFKNRAGIEL